MIFRGHWLHEDNDHRRYRFEVGTKNSETSSDAVQTRIGNKQVKQISATMLKNTFSMLSVCLVVLLCLLIHPEESAALSSRPFITTRARGSNVAIAWSTVKYQRRIAVKLSTEEESTMSGELKGVSSTPVDPPVPTTTTLPSKQLSSSSAVEQLSYPIDLPSPILLATSMILAIVGTGTVPMNVRCCCEESPTLFSKLSPIEHLTSTVCVVFIHLNRQRV